MTTYDRKKNERLDVLSELRHRVATLITAENTRLRAELAELAGIVRAALGGTL
jgi:uncharacterized small protein (DUF1192 family)